MSLRVMPAWFRETLFRILCCMAAKLNKECAISGPWASQCLRSKFSTYPFCILTGIRRDAYLFAKKKGGSWRQPFTSHPIKWPRNYATFYVSNRVVRYEGVNYGSVVFFSYELRKTYRIVTWVTKLWLDGTYPTPILLSILYF